jgi:hypothetical protein
VLALHIALDPRIPSKASHISSIWTKHRVSVNWIVGCTEAAIVDTSFVTTDYFREDVVKDEFRKRITNGEDRRWQSRKIYSRQVRSFGRYSNSAGGCEMASTCVRYKRT